MESAQGSRLLNAITLPYLPISQCHLLIQPSSCPTRPQLHDSFLASGIQPSNSILLTANVPYHSPHSPSSFFPPAGPPFLTALVPMPLGFFFSCVAFMRASPTLENSSQKSCFSFAGPLGASPNESQKSFFSGSRRDVEEVGWAESPSTKRLNVVPALATPEERVWPSVPAVRWAWVARSASASFKGQPLFWKMYINANIPSASPA
jgi:hypothetical protein